MAQEPGLSDQYSRASPWPIPLVLGLAISELGLLLGASPVAIGGLLLLGGSIVGILRESSFIDTLWESTLIIGIIFGIFGSIIFTQTNALQRGFALLIAATITIVAAIVLFLLETKRL